LKFKFLILVSICLIAITTPLNCKSSSDSINYKQEDVSITFTTIPCGNCGNISSVEYRIGFSEVNFTIRNQSLEFSQRLTLWCNFEDGDFSISGLIDKSTLIMTETHNASILTHCYCITYISGLITNFPSNISSLVLRINVKISGAPHFTTAISYPFSDFTSRNSGISPFDYSFTMISIFFAINSRRKK
jgi:hypothetical protein